MADEILGLDFDTTAAKKSLANLVTYVERIQKKFEQIKIKFQVDQKSWERAKNNLANKAEKLKDVVIKIQVAPPTKGNIKQTVIQTNALLKDVKLQSIATTLKPPTKANVSQLVPQINALLANIKTTSVKLNFTFGKSGINSLIRDVKTYFGTTKSNMMGINLRINRGKGKQTLDGTAQEFATASAAKDKFYLNVQQVFPKLEAYFQDLGIAAGFATNRLISFFKQANKNLGGIKGTVKSLTKLSTLKIAPNTTGLTNLFGRLEGIGHRFRLFAFDFYIFGQALMHGVIRPLVSSTNAFRLFEQNMKNAQVLSGASEGEFLKIETALQKFSTTTRYSKTVLSELVDEFARAGVNVDTMESALKSVIDLSDAVGKAGATSAENIREAYNILTDAFFAFGEQYRGIAKERVFDKIANSVAAAANASKADLGDFTYFMNQVSASAAQAGVSLDETLSIFSTMKQVMGSGRMAASALNQAFVQLATFENENEFPAIVKRLEQIGLTASDIKPSIVGLKQAIDNIFKINPTDNDLVKIFGTEGSRVPNLLKATGDEYARISAQVSAYSNTLLDLNSVERLAERTRDTANYKIETLISNFQNLKIEIGRLVAGELAGFVKSLTFSIEGMINWIKVHKESIVTFIHSLTFVGLLTAGMYALGIAVQGVIKVFTTLRLVSFGLARSIHILVGLFQILAVKAFGARVAYLSFAASNLRIQRSVLISRLALINLSSMFTKAGAAALFAAFGVSTFQAIVSVGTALAVITASVFAVYQLFKSVGDLNEELASGLGTIPSYTDALASQEYQYSSTSNEIKTYTERLKEQIEAEKELIALRNSAKPLTESQGKRLTELSGQSKPDEQILSEIDTINKAISTLQQKLSRSVNTALNDVIKNQIKDLETDKIALEEIFNERKGILDTKIIENAAKIQIDLVGRLTELKKKASSQELSSKEFEEYNDKLKQLDYLLEKFKNTDFTEELTKQQANIRYTVTTITELQKKIAEFEKTEDITDGKRTARWIHRAEEVQVTLDEIDRLKNDPMVGSILPKIKNAKDTKEIIDLIKTVNLEPLVKDSSDLFKTLDQLSKLKFDRSDLTEISKFLSIENQKALNDFNAGIEDIDKAIDAGINKSLSEADKKVADLNKEFNSVLTPLETFKELNDKAVLGIQEQIDAAKDRKKPESEIKYLYDQQTTLLDKQKIIADIIAQVEGRKADALVNQTLELERQLKAQRDQLVIENMRLKGQDQEAELKKLKVDYEVDKLGFMDTISSDKSTEDEKKFAREQLALRTENYDLEVIALNNKYEEEKQIYLKQLELDVIFSDKKQKGFADRLKVTTDFNKALDDLDKKKLSPEKKLEAEVKLREKYRNDIDAINDEIIGDEAKYQLEIEKLKTQGKNKEIEIAESNHKHKQQAAETQVIIDDPTSTNAQRAAARERLKNLKDVNDAELKLIDDKYNDEKEAYLKQLELNSILSDKTQKNQGERLQITYDYLQKIDELAKKEGLTLEERSQAKIKILKEYNNKINAINDEIVDEAKQDQLKFVEAFFDTKLQQVEDKINALNANGGNPRVIANLQKQKEELTKQKDIWTKIVQSGGKFDAQMASAKDFIRAMRLEQDRLINAQQKAMDLLMRLAKAQNAYNKHLQIYNALKAAGKDTSFLDPILNEDIAKITGYSGQYQRQAKAAEMPGDIPNFDGHKALQAKLESDKLATQKFAEDLKQTINNLILEVGNSAGDLGREFFNKLTYWFPIILDAASQFTKLLSFILDPTKPKSPPITDVVARGVDIIGAEFSRLNDTGFSDNLRKTFSGLNLNALVPERIAAREISPAGALVGATKTINDTSTHNFNVHTNRDEHELIRKIDLINRRRYTRVGL